MSELDDRIARLELVSEQLGLHLQELPRNSADAEQARSQLYHLIEELAGLKAQRLRQEAESELAA